MHDLIYATLIAIQIKVFSLAVQYLNFNVPPTSSTNLWQGVRMRVRNKFCNECNEPRSALYRCRYAGIIDWVFLCEKCLSDVKIRFEDSYQYGGTWKSKKK